MESQPQLDENLFSVFSLYLCNTILLYGQLNINTSIAAIKEWVVTIEKLLIDNLKEDREHGVIQMIFKNIKEVGILCEHEEVSIGDIKIHVRKRMVLPYCKKEDVDIPDENVKCIIRQMFEDEGIYIEEVETESVSSDDTVYEQ